MAPNTAEAAVFTFAGTYDGNDCDGASPFGGTRGFDRCTYLDSPTIAKYNFNDGVPGAVEKNNTEFPSIDGSEFTITFNSGSDSSGSWSYSPLGDDPAVVTAFVVKAGNAFSIFEWDATSGIDFTNILWDTATLGNRALSHITFFDTGADTPPPIPLPAAGFLLVGALGGLAVLRRRRKA